jgi:hypothetical protein
MEAPKETFDCLNQPLRLTAIVAQLYSARNPAPADNAPIPRPQDNFESASAAPSAVGEVSSSAIDAADITEPPVPQQAFAITAGNAASIAD